ncbi:SNF2 family N-terminal domain-containing protein [Hysterangium stoloniferum]|nr:SNF2 family N-terminal domain-containing protein [Hysterangium stoloniferum]
MTESKPCTNASRVLLALDNVLAGYDLQVMDITPASDSIPEGAHMPLRKRKALEEQRRKSPSKRRETMPTSLQGAEPSNPRLHPTQLFPNAFQASPKRNPHNNIQMQTENAKIGLPLPDALKALGLNSPHEVFPGLEIKLMKHQIIGVSWMLKQEQDITIRGGILADEMGLGKTVQIIGLMVVNQRDSSQRSQEEDGKHDEEAEEKENVKVKSRKRIGFSKTTLIVAPASLLRQWKEEIETKCQEGLLRVHIHHGKYKLKTVKVLKQFDVILVSYQTLTAEFPSHLDTSDQSDWLPEMGGILAKMKWHRVVLDEAQVVRNRMTQSAQCIFRLQAKYRWCLSGTPIFNGVSDIFPYLRFCRPGYYSWDLFNNHILRTEKRDSAAATKRANEWLDPLMLRRTKMSKLDGRFILEELPPKNVEIVELEFSEGERKIYDDYAASVERKIREIIARGKEEEYHMYILVLILRLRQICGHPFLMLGIDNPLDDPSKMPQHEKDKEISRARRELGRQFVDDMKAEFRRRALKRDQVDGEKGMDSCRGCREVFSGNAMIVACGHEACEECLEDLTKSELRLTEDMPDLDKDETSLRPCPTCKKLIDPGKRYRSAAFEVSEEDLIFGSGGYRKALDASEQKTKRWQPDSDDDELPDTDFLMRDIGKDEPETRYEDRQSSLKSTPSTSGPCQMPFLTPRESSKLSDAANLSRWKNQRTPSTKLIALLNMLKEWDRDTTSSMDKVIIYSQWTTMLDLVEDQFEQYNISSLRYDGKMGREERDEAISCFKKIGGPKIILISIKSGSLGLNLTCSNRIINLDLSWSMQAEQQAYDRAHRIGQSKPVFIKRFVVKNTIEAKRLQRKKQEVADATLGEGDAPVQRTSASLTTRDLTSVRSSFASLNISYGA